MNAELIRIASNLLTGGWASACIEDWPARPTGKSVVRAAKKDADRRRELANALIMDQELQGQLIYLASPYTHSDAAVRQTRYEQALAATAQLMRQGYHIWAPIVYTHQLATAGMPVEWHHWAEFDGMMLRRCQELWVLALDGWNDSKGVQGEVRLAFKLGITVRPITYEDAATGVAKHEDYRTHLARRGPLLAMLEPDDKPHPVGCVCAECEQEAVREAMASEM